MKVIECVSGKGGATMTHKILKMLMLTALLAGIGTSSLTNAQADSTQKTTASATLVSGVNGGIKLDSAPDVSFSAQLTGNEIKDLAGTQTDDLQVTNAGSATGWNVKVAASAMTDADGQPLAGATYGFTTTAAKPLDENNNSTALPTTSALTVLVVANKLPCRLPQKRAWEFGKVTMPNHK